MKKEQLDNSRRNFLKMAALGGAALGMATVPGLANAAGLVTSDESNDQVGKINQSGKLHAAKGKSVMGLACKPIKTVRIGLIGIGMRGSGAVTRLMQIEGVEFKAFCDLVPGNVKNANKTLVKAGFKEAAEYTAEGDWKKVCERDDIDLIYTCTPWYLHTPIAVYAMKHGKHAATEVPAAMTLSECWQLVDTAEETQRHCMMLENCCYDFFELATLNMVRNDVFGDIYHAEGAYNHDLRELKFNKNGYYHMWRLEYSKKHTGNLYPTHGLGPIAQIMGINRSDRFESLTSSSTKQYGLSLYAKEHFGANSPEYLQEYKLGDVNNSVIHTAKGKTILLQHNTTSPQPYSRIHRIMGTKGLAVKYPDPLIAINPSPDEFLKKADFDALMKKYEHPLATQIGEKAKKVGGHGGMDFIMDYRLIYCLRNGLPLDQSVYDAAAWSSIVELSELSVNNKSAAVQVPDFTRGVWQNTKPLPIVSLD
ncbi:MAG: Gfo/Idh/MocA family oxidoreductase [Bacteroidota bacterium]|nr:Gfo/Idh/MocA family oxidoreductase [Bacteroidota bacterium]